MAGAFFCKSATLTTQQPMAKKLKSRFRKLFKNMSKEPTKDILDEQENMQQPENATAGNNENTSTGSTDMDNLSPELEKWQKEAADWKDKYMRLYAEFDNYRKRTIKEKSDILSTASADLMKVLLPILDDFDRAMKANESTDDLDAVKEGFVLIFDKLFNALTAKGLKPIHAAGQPFDTDFHEAVAHIPAPEDHLKGKVIEEAEKGYLLNDKVIRHSKVVTGH